MSKVYHVAFEDIASPERLFTAFEVFRIGKSKRPDVQEFESQLEERIFALHRELISGEYRHGSYKPFTICDPKQRKIHKASVRDRIVHHAVFTALYPVFDPTFISHSYSCRENKGTHRGVNALEKMLRQVSKNSTKSCFALKCDVYQFFASVNHAVLLRILGEKIKDEKIMVLLREIIGSFPFHSSIHPESRGIPIGNLTSQLFANVYMNEFDQYMKHKLRVKHFIRYTDDFVIVSQNKHYLLSLLPKIRLFLSKTLHLNLHPHKISIRTFSQGIDFLGLVVLPHHRMLRTKTKRRMLTKLCLKAEECRDDEAKMTSLQQSLQSYLGVLSHADAYCLSQDLKNQYSVLV